MTALPDRAYLRRYALPAHFLAELGRMTESGAAFPLAAVPPHRPAAPGRDMNADSHRVAVRTGKDKPSG